MKDLVTKSCLAGIVSFSIKNLINEVLYYSKITTFEYHTEASTLVLPLSKSQTVYGTLLGLAIDLILVCWVALAIGFILRKTGQDYSLIKGGIVGASSWLIIYGYFVHTGALGLYKAADISSGMTTLLLDIVSGIISAAVLVDLAGRATDSLQ